MASVLSGDFIQSNLPELTVSLLTDGVETSKDEILEIRDEMASAMRELREAKVQLEDASEDIALGRRREKELILRIDQLTLEKKKLSADNDRLDSEKQKLNAKNQELIVKYNTLRDEYNKSVNMMINVYRRMTPTKKRPEDCALPGIPKGKPIVGVKPIVSETSC